MAWDERASAVGYETGKGGQVKSSEFAQLRNANEGASGPDLGQMAANIAELSPDWKE